MAMPTSTYFVFFVLIFAHMASAATIYLLKGTQTKHNFPPEVKNSNLFKTNGLTQKTLPRDPVIIKLLQRISKQSPKLNANDCNGRICTDNIQHNGNSLEVNNPLRQFGDRYHHHSSDSEYHEDYEDSIESFDHDTFQDMTRGDRRIPENPRGTARFSTDYIDFNDLRSNLVGEKEKDTKSDKYVGYIFKIPRGRKDGTRSVKTITLTFSLGDKQSEESRKNSTQVSKESSRKGKKKRQEEEREQAESEQDKSLEKAAKAIEKIIKSFSDISVSDEDDTGNKRFEIKNSKSKNNIKPKQGKTLESSEDDITQSEEIDDYKKKSKKQNNLPLSEETDENIEKSKKTVQLLPLSDETDEKQTKSKEDIDLSLSKETVENSETTKKLKRKKPIQSELSQETDEETTKSATNKKPEQPQPTSKSSESDELPLPEEIDEKQSETKTSESSEEDNFPSSHEDPEVQKEEIGHFKKESYSQGFGRIKVGPNAETEARKRLQHFMPKRYHWDEEDIHNLGYLWFNGPQGNHPTGAWRVPY